MHIRRLPRTFFLPLLGLLQFAGIPQLHAQDVDEGEDLARVYGDKLFVSIATGNRQPITRAPAIASVITAKEIVAMGATDLNQVLLAIPGLHVTREAGGYEAIFQMRGTANNLAPHILVLQDGIPLTTLLTSSKGQMWSSYSTENIERVEVMRGPGSALYGADAYAGVINIITKSAANKPGWELGAQVGNFKSKASWLQYGLQQSGLEIAAFLHLAQTAGSKEQIDSDAQSLRDLASGTRASLAPGKVNRGHDAASLDLQMRLQNWRLLLSYKLRDNIGTGAGISSALDPVGKLKSERLNLDLIWSDKQFSKDWELGGNLSSMWYQQRIPEHLRLFPPGTRFPTGLFVDGMIGHPDTSERHVRLHLHAGYNGWPGHRLRIGAGAEDQNMYHTATIKNYEFNAFGIPVPVGQIRDYSQIQGFLSPHRRTLHYFYAQDEWQTSKNISITTGLRHDHYSDFGGTSNLRLAAVWRIRYDLSAKFMHGSAFRAPSFTEAYSTNNPVRQANPQAKPETVKTTEIGLNWQASPQFSGNVNAFFYRMRDILVALPIPAPGIGSKVQNAGSQNGHGIELEASWSPVKDWQLSGHYAWQNSEDGRTGQDPGYFPRHRLYLRTEHHLPQQWIVGMQLNYVMQRKRASGDTRPAIADYHMLDLSLRKQWQQGKLEAALLINNLMNRDARDPSQAPGLIANDLPLSGRAVQLQMRYRF